MGVRESMIVGGVAARDVLVCVERCRPRHGAGATRRVQRVAARIIAACFLEASELPALQEAWRTREQVPDQPTPAPQPREALQNASRHIRTRSNDADPMAAARAAIERARTGREAVAVRQRAEELSRRFSLGASLLPAGGQANSAMPRRLRPLVPRRPLGSSGGDTCRPTLRRHQHVTVPGHDRCTVAPADTRRSRSMPSTHEARVQLDMKEAIAAGAPAAFADGGNSAAAGARAAQGHRAAEPSQVPAAPRTPRAYSAQCAGPVARWRCGERLPTLAARLRLERPAR